MGCDCSKVNKLENNYLKSHWDDVYTKPKEQLGWYEKEATPTIQLFAALNLPKHANIFMAGAGTTTFVDYLVEQDYTSIFVNDISSNAIQQLKERLTEHNSKINYIIDDLTHPSKLNDLPPINFWYDRAVLHFFNDEEEIITYFHLLKDKVISNGYVLLAEFNPNSADKCSGLLVHKYTAEEMQHRLGSNFKLQQAFNYEYTMPNGNIRHYIYALFRREK
ncbi:MAG: hypothetical protein K6T34_01475 [Thermoflavifilum sp.]|nr:hypothetical protein [Thermoflavifilum sp.]